MKNRRGRLKTVLAVCLLLSIMIFYTGCSNQTGDNDSMTAATAESVGNENGKSTEESGSKEGGAASSPSGSETEYAEAEELFKEVSELIASAGKEQPVELTGESYTINAGGTYRLSGTIESGQLVVEAGKDDTVVLIFDGVSITNPEDAAVKVEQAGEVVIVLERGTENTITSGTAVEISDNSEGDESASGAALHSKDDLWITGEGSLVVGGYINNGIHSSDTLYICGGDITIEAVNNAVKSKEEVRIAGGNITVTAGNDGIKASDSNDESIGSIIIYNGELHITAYGDGIQAADDLTVCGGNYTMVTGTGSAAASTAADSGFGGMGGFGGWGERGTGWDMSDESTDSAKGLKAGSSISIYGGTFEIDSYDDSVHSNGNILICGGSFTLSSGDDGVHADKELDIQGGNIAILTCYEGLEANQILIGDGTVSITAYDDGINANGGSSAMGWGFGGGSTSSGEDMPNLIIRGGDIYVNASGDGLDSNGNLLIEGGNIIVDGPSDSGNGALDYGMENGGTCIVNGGTILALGSSGMSETFDASSGQCSFRYYCTSAYNAGDRILIADSEGNTLYSYTAVKSGNCIIFSSPELTQGEAYSVTVGSENAELTLTSVSTDGGSGNGYENFGGFGGHGGDRGGMDGKEGEARPEMPEGDDRFPGGQEMPDDMPELPEGGMGPGEYEIPDGKAQPGEYEIPPQDGMPLDRKEGQKPET